MIFNFDTKETVELNQVGGKAKALIETTQAGFPVPEGIALSVDFFKPWFETIKSSSQWETAISNVNKEHCDKIIDMAQNLQFTELQKDQFDKAIENLQGQVFAVRSSSPEEDLAGSSFAGMYETYLGTLIDDLERTVAKAFSSCFDYRVMAYKTQHQFDLKDTAISVIVQKQIPSDISGVGFSLNPLNNCYDEVFINASHGLGEAIVSGIVTPDTYIVDIVNHKIISKEIGSKSIQLNLNEAGGISEIQNPQSDEQALTDSQIFELSMLIKKCESHFGVPMDIEWAFANDQLYLLQSRPITTYVPLYEVFKTKPGEQKMIYVDLMGLTQGFTENMSNLGMDFWAQTVDALKNGTINASINGNAPAYLGRQYINVSYLYGGSGKFLGNMMINNYDKGLKKIFDNIDFKNDYKVSSVPKESKGSKKALFSTMFAMVPSALEAKRKDPKALIDEYNEITKDIMKTAEQLNPSMTAQEMFDIAIVDISKLMNCIGFILAGLMANNKLHKMFKGSGLEDAVISLGMNLDGNPTSDMGHQLFRLASSPEFKSVKSVEAFINNMNTRSFSENYMNQLDAFLKLYGCRGFKEIDIASERMYENYGLLYEKLININTEDSQITDVEERRAVEYNKLLEYAKAHNFEKKFIQNAMIYQKTMGYREHPKYMIVWAFSKIHDNMLIIGERLEKEGKLDDKYHVFDLLMKDIDKAQNGDDIDLRKARTEYMKEVNKLNHVRDFPLVIDSRGKIFKPTLEMKDGDLQGAAIASGVAEGRAKVLRSPYEKPLLPGEILVAPATEPSWTPIFINAAGVVMEVGGPLQHGGIIAREYGIPCVSGLLGILEIIEDGDLIRVDGSNGVITILEKAGSKKEA